MIGYFRGFSLIELMIVIAIVAILGTIAYPAYQQYVLTSHRVEAKSMLLHAANRQETYFMDFNQYASSAAALGISSASENGLYQLSIAVSGNTYTLSASAGAATAQANDTDCTVFSINQLGVKSASGAASNSCWE
ncbi:type IV pilin protein [Aeromonas veronii]|uniref:type IV pilin protein n=1 Tax=Aeromonas veronii TaxID=654 RepID=UPI001FD7093D|nr:type IV pilin protein [Aeromonas veronii]MCJ8215016.1 type IV pilin protein [Aeromonas veronii]USP57812.1 type IV pilin protein [Aeromonas veronii]